MFTRDALPTGDPPPDGTPPQAPPAEVPPTHDAPASDRRRRVRTVAGWVGTTLAAVLVLFALLAPNQTGLLTPAAFLRISLEGLLAVALVLVLPARPRRVAAVVVGVILGLLAIWKLIDMGFFSLLARRFDPVFDWPLLVAASEFLTESVGRTAAIGVVIAAVVLSVAVLVLMPLAVLRLSRLLAGHPRPAGGTAAALGVVWVICALLSVQIVPGVPVAASDYGRLLRVQASLQDRGEFAAAATVDAFGDTPGDQLLTALRGKDVVIVFVESYGRDAVEDPEFAPVTAVLDAGERRLRADGYASRSAFLTAPTAGGASWFGHATLLSGLWVNNQRRYRTLVTGDRMTLNSAFQRAGWRTVAVMPGIFHEWPESEFYGYDQVYAAADLDYQGPRMNWGMIPDQYTLSMFQRAERARPDREPVMAEIALLSSHGPWAIVPHLINWHTVGDGTAFEDVTTIDESPDAILRDSGRARTAYGLALAYSLETVISYVETYGDDDLVMVFLGDHQPAPLVTRDGATRDVPISIITRDQAVMEQISGWGWQDGLRPAATAPLWRMDTFRDEFLTAFGPPGRPAG